MTAPLSGLDPSQSLAALQAKPKEGTDLDKDSFMKLLVAQMKYQNPSAPTDGKEYLAQMAQFAMVEKLDAISAAQADLMAWQKNLVGESLVGRTVTGAGATGSVTAQVTGLTLTDKGPLLELAGGGQLAIDKVEKVTGGSSSPATGTPTT